MVSAPSLSHANSGSHDVQLDRHFLMNKEITIESPQPRRLLKQETFEVENTTTEDYQLPQPFIELPERSRSDSFLLTMSVSRISRELHALRMKEGGLHLPIFFPSPSISPYSSVSNTSNTLTSISSESCSSSRAVQPTYRDDLKRNNIHINPRKRSSVVLQYASNILKVECDSPGLTDTEAQAISDHMSELQHGGDEPKIQKQFEHFDIVPLLHQLPGPIVRGDGTPFSVIGLPQSPLAPLLAHPKPDHHYSFNCDSFTDEQEYKQSTKTLKSFSTPSTTGRWPFLTIEFKSQAKGGTIWVAENQIATSSAQLVHSVKQLLSLTACEHNITDSISFSCTMDAKNVGIWVSYCEEEEHNGRRKFCSIEIAQYSMFKNKDIIECRSAIRNILAWGINTRLPKLISALDTLKIEHGDGKRKQKRVRAANSVDGTSHKRSHINQSKLHRHHL